MFTYYLCVELDVGISDVFFYSCNRIYYCVFLKEKLQVKRFAMGRLLTLNDIALKFYRIISILNRRKNADNYVIKAG